MMPIVWSFAPIRGLSVNLLWLRGVPASEALAGPVHGGVCGSEHRPAVHVRPLQRGGARRGKIDSTRVEQRLGQATRRGWIVEQPAARHQIDKATAGRRGDWQAK